MSLASDISDDFWTFTDILLGSTHRIQTFLAEGGFGYVAKCEDTRTKKSVAVKISKNHPTVFHQAQKELAILKSLQTLDPDKCNIIRWNGSFLHEERICLEFELLDQSLFDFMEQRCNQPLPIKELRPVVHQLTTALTHLETVGVIHADIKPENIMIVNRHQQPLSVKLIDFGIACRTSAAGPESCVQTLWYRAPEVILGLAVSEAIDIWSLGLVVVELALGCPLYPAEQEYDLMKFIVETQGQPAEHLLNCGSRSTSFFHKTSEQPWRFKSPEEFAAETGYHCEETRFFTLSSLDDIEQMAARLMLRDMEEQNELQNLTELVKKMLQLDAHRRIKPAEVLQHSFFCADQLTDSNVDSCSLMQTLTTEIAEPQISLQCSSPDAAGDRVASELITNIKNQSTYY
ncbi:homeodomain-interacting protein kinase 2-like [Thunnus albacares]|uniref:homeodomain-interacting protein kinase 2-like n=1 Tax=Thunnus albacares TaxID=8236 RepID=UPI001CF6636F|nr:homeodomain-interacting protein kinase 2-like [Thunnus albacares]